MRATVWTIFGGGGGAGGVARGSPDRNVRPKKIKSAANGSDVFMGLEAFLV
jgi:hypothetical protein